MKSSIETLAEEVLQEVKSAKLTKLAQHQFVKESAKKPNITTNIGKALVKLAEDLRSNSGSITAKDLEDFVNGKVDTD